MTDSKYLYNNEQAASFKTHNTERSIGPYGNEGSLDGNGNISRPMYMTNKMTIGGKRKTSKKSVSKRMHGGGFGFGSELKVVGHGLHPEVVKTMACEQATKDFSPNMSGGAVSEVKDSYILVDSAKINYPMEGVASENGVPYHGFGLDNKGMDLRDFAGSYAPISAGVHGLTGGAEFLSFWNSICPGAVNIYNMELKNKNQKDPKVLAVIKNYTKVFRTEVAALKTRQISRVKRMLVSMRGSLMKAKKALVSLKSKMLDTHKMISEMHLGRVTKHLMSLKETKKAIKKMSTKLRKTMRGGYHQYGNNTVQSSGYTPVLGSDSSESTPHHVKPHAGNSLDNYNHYTGKTASSPILEQDVVVPEKLEAPVGASLF
jgi:hypothetical protein